jgi:hypothetical protein
LAGNVIAIMTRIILMGNPLSEMTGIRNAPELQLSTEQIALWSEITARNGKLHVMSKMELNFGLKPVSPGNYFTLNCEN